MVRINVYLSHFSPFLERFMSVPFPFRNNFFYSTLTKYDICPRAIPQLMQ